MIEKQLYPEQFTLAFVVLFSVSVHAAVPAKDSVDFETQIRPLLHERCYSCHGPEVQKNGLRLDTKTSALKGGDSGAAIVPGESGKSELIRRIGSNDPDEFMPPKGERLSAQQIALFRRWIDAGAKWPEPTATPAATTDNRANHWAWRPVQPVAVPSPKRMDWAANEVDRFILDRLEKDGRSPAPPADKRTLLRRVTFDLIGLPPTPQDIGAFLADDSPRALATVIDRLLASPRYGERWGRHWMDVVRYADTAGDNADYPVPEARLYRDYIIDSFNADKPYDQFVHEQLAGDILAKNGPPEKYAEHIVATGFLALSRRDATAPFELMHLTIEDAIETTGRTFLGLTLRCARCHDHKYDPVTSEDYYGMYGLFASTRFPFAGSEEFQSKNFPRSGFVPLIPPDQSKSRFAAHQQRIESLKTEISRREKDLTAAKDNAEQKKKLEAQLAPLRLEFRRRTMFGAPPDVPVAYAVVDDKPVNQAIHKRGEPSDLGAVMPRRRAPRFIASESPLSIASGSSGRREFAQWLTRPDNPLTARVMVNRIWQHHFGQGLVRTPSNFGVRGELPTHPQLLDWLAKYFVEHGWSVKAMHRLILNSATWRQSSNSAGSSDNQLYAHFDRRRLDAEGIRDAMLFVAGTLELDRPGANPFPKFDDWHWTQHNPFKAVYDSRHRSVYLMRQRIQRHPYLALFDAPDANVSTDVRTTATVPQQALFLMNHPFVREQSAALAKRILADSASDDTRIHRAVELVWSRLPQVAEIQAAMQYLSRFTAQAAKTGLSPDAARLEAWTSYARVLLTANEFLYLD